MRAGTENIRAPASHQELTPEREAAVKAARQWVHQLARTIKSSRLYGSLTSPVVERAQLELANSLQRLLEAHGPLVLRFSSNDIFAEGASLYPARSREDNLALPFYRDGIRKIRFSPGVDSAELGVVIDAILRVTGQSHVEDDFVTLLWQAQLGHVEIEYVPAEAEGDGHGPLPFGSSGSGVGSGLAPGLGGGGSGAGAGGFDSGGGPGWGGGAPDPGAGGPGWGDGVESGGDEFSGDGPGFFGPAAGDSSDGTETGVHGVAGDEAPGLPWPHWEDAVGLMRVDEAADSGDPEEPGRSDDWRVDSRTVEADEEFERLALAAEPDLESFRARLEDERQVPIVTAAIRLARAYLAASETHEDRVEMGRFLPRVIREAVAENEWGHASEALTLLLDCHPPDWSIDTLAQELCHPTSVASAAAGFESLEPAQVDEFVAFAGRLEESAVDLLGRLLVEIEGSRHEQRLIEAIAADCRVNPERLAPWLGDPRWNVVRNTVRILDRIGGDAIAGLLQAVAEHPEAAVREQVAKALEGVSLPRAKSLLIRLLDDADTPTFCSIIQRLGQFRDGEVARLLLSYLTHPEFERQPAEEQRAVYAAIVTAGGDRVLPQLEAELHKGNWFDHSSDAHRQAVAKCVQQIGTPLARRVLERCARSHRAELRKTCRELLARFGKS